MWWRMQSIRCEGEGFRLGTVAERGIILHLSAGGQCGGVCLEWMSQENENGEVLWWICGSRE